MNYTNLFVTTGKDCQIDVNECETNPCKNGGECVDLINRFRCICPVGFAGDLCEVSRNITNIKIR